jgi:hypothetical protein
VEAVCAFNVAAEIETGFKRTGKLTLTGLTKPLCVGGGATVRGSFVVNTTETWFYIVQKKRLRTHVTNMATCQKIVSELSLGASESEARRGGHF